MTKEEIIEQLENTILLIEQNGKDWWDERDIPLLKIMIQILKQQPRKDTISREAAIDAIAETIVNGESLGYSLACDILSDLPPITPRPKMGHWINGDPICPCCGEDKFKDLDADIWSDWQPKYCPNCGAKMKEGE